MDTELDELFGKPSLVIDENNLNEEFCEISASLGYWAYLAAEWEAKLQEAKYALERIKSNQTELAKAYIKSKDERPTEKAAEAKALNTNAVVEAEKTYVRAVRYRNYLRGIVLAYQCKRDSLIGLGQLKRAELKLEPFIK